jgi:hypothetical protein
MVSVSEKEKVGSGKQSGSTAGQQRVGKMLADRPSKDGTAQRAALDVEGLKGYVRVPDWNIRKQRIDRENRNWAIALEKEPSALFIEL